MLKQIRQLTGILLCDMFGINQVRFGKDAKKKNRLMLLMITFLLLGIMLIFYAGVFAYGLIAAGMEKIIPAYALTVVSLMILFFSVYKAGSIIFQMKSYEMLISLPITPAAIVVSRFLTMYVQNTVMGMFIFLPIMGVYGVMVKPGAGFYIMMLFGGILLPLIPMTIATSIGALILAVSSRMKHKNLVNILLNLIVVIGILAASALFGASAGELQMSDADLMRNLGEILERELFSLYPPARLFSEGAAEGKILSFLAFAGLSVGIFLLMTALIQWKFVTICTAINARSARKNYQMQELSQKSPLLALYKRELKRYFASSIYVLNTMIGCILMVVLAVGVLISGTAEIEQMMGLSGKITKVLPMVLAFACGLSPTTVSSVSMEGKQWWIAKSLPVSTGQLINSKVMVNLTIALPCYFVTEIILFFAMDMSVTERIFLFVIPLVYIFYATVLGIVINLKMPSFQWESEAAVVKQSGAVLLAMLFSFLSAGIPLGLAFVLEGAALWIMLWTVIVVLCVVTVILYFRSCRTDLKNLD